MSLLKSYYMPAEWAPHDACFLQHPHNGCTFRLPQARKEVLGVVKAIAKEGDEPVVIFCNTAEDATSVQEQIENWSDADSKSKITTKVCPSNDSWARDMGPTFVVAKDPTQQPKRIGIDWEFNAWGGLMSDYEKDKLVAQQMCEELVKKDATGTSTATEKISIVLEGGSIHVDGEGTILTTKECLLHPNRNPTKIQQELETILCESLGAAKVIWLPEGLFGDDDTNGHVDNFACFLKPGHVILSWTDDEENDKENYERCRRALKLLEQETDAKGRTLTVHKLYLPPPIFFTQEDVEGLEHSPGGFADPRTVGKRMAGSYVNFYVANKAVVIPQYGHKESDQKAVDTLTNLFAPDRKVVGVPTRDILIGGGNIHCITQQLPSV